MANKTRSYQRSSAWYRGKGYQVVRTEFTNRGKSHDLMGIIDFLALGIGHLIAVQACGADWKPHVDKMLGSHADSTMAWLRAGNRLQLLGWRKIGKPARWTPRLSEFRLDARGDLVLYELFR